MWSGLRGWRAGGAAQLVMSPSTAPGEGKTATTATRSRGGSSLGVSISAADCGDSFDTLRTSTGGSDGALGTDTAAAAVAAAAAATGTDMNMAPASTLDLLVLTFNCAKNLINVAVFATHLQAALRQNATGPGALPDLVVFSLQEVAPLSYSFIGSYFLQPYYSRFEQALNLAAVKVAADLPVPPVDDDDENAGHDGIAPLLKSQGPRVGNANAPYQLVRARNVGMTAIMLFARTPAAIHHIQEAECGFGAADMGNKGAVGLRVMWSEGGLDSHVASSSSAADRRGEPGVTELTFVATHLAAMEWNLKKRNANWRSIVSALAFENPKAVLERLPRGELDGEDDDDDGRPSEADTMDHGSDEGVSGSEADEENEASKDSDTHPLLAASRTDPNVLRTNRALRDISVYKPGSHLFVAGDLNYRISTTTPPLSSPFPSFDNTSENYWPNFISRDQLTAEKRAGRTLNGFEEAEIRFGPSYKYVVLQDKEEADNIAEVEDAERRGKASDVVPWRFARHRWPSWCDRVLFMDIPEWVRRTTGITSYSDVDTDASARNQQAQTKKASEAAGAGISVRAYDILPVVRTSDHRPVYLRLSVPVLSPEDLEGTPPHGADDDPRVKLPVAIDIEAYERRAAARRKEMMVGWSMFLFSTGEGAMLLATVMIMGLGGWWLARGV